MTSRDRSEPTPMVFLVVDAALIVTAVGWLASRELWALLAWEVVGTGYLLGGLAVVWRGSRHRSGSVDDARLLARLSWILPVVASAVGVSAAVTALAARSAPHAGSDGHVVLAIAGSVGVVLSWTVLHVGFAQIYQYLDESSAEGPSIDFPGRDDDSFLNFLYFSFTIGTAFATSDAKVTTLAVRRVVLLHSVVAFFYNALVVATAIQVVQQLVST